MGANKVKIQSNQLGVCPYCGSESIDYGPARFEADLMYFPCTCMKCKRYFEEWNSLNFVGLNVGRSGEHQAEDVLGKEIEYNE